jgi:hypothetical protein
MGRTMETKTFLQKALSREGYYCVFAARASDERKVQKFYDTIDAVVDAANNFDLEGYDVYYGLATFHEAGSRKVSNVKHLNSFFLDLDCGPSKEFLSQAQAVDALRAFCKKHTLPKPTMASSGRGVHVYWFLSESVPYDDWYPVAERLKRLCAEDGFAADPAVTSDAARVLRVPHTHNYKTDPPSEVKFYGQSTPKFETVDFDAFSELLGTDVIPVPTKYTPVAMSATMQNLMGNQENVFKDILLKTSMGKGCSQIAYILKNQETMSEPMWRAGLSIAKFCIDGEKSAHKLSHKHPEYTVQATGKKLDLIKGPYTCVRFDEYNPDVCPNCPHWGEIKSPIVLGRKLREAEVDEEGNYEAEPDALKEPQYVIPRYPAPYVRGANGGVYVRTRDQDGDIEEKVIYPYDLYVVKRIRNPEIGEMIMMRLHLPHDAVREFTIAMSTVTSREELRKALSAQGVAVPRMDEIMNYTLKWVEELQATSVADEAHVQFGWADDTHEAFILGSQTVKKDSIENNPPATQTANYFPHFKPKGTFEDWKEAIKFWQDERFVLQQFGLGMGFGSPLMEFLNEPCGAVAFINNESGVGKTMMLLAAAGIWGDPDKLVLKAGDKPLYKLNRAEVMHSLPVGIDEVTNMTPKQMSELIYQGTQGTQPGRMTAQANVERFQGRPWSLLMGYTANTSIVETVSRGKAMPKAEAQRVLECRVKRLLDSHGDKERQDEFKKKILNNYGHAGVVFIQWVMRNLDETNALLEKVRRRVDKEAELTSENRFWSDAITATITGLLISKHIGLHEYDVSKVFKWATTDLVNQNKEGLNEMAMTVPDLLNDFFNEHVNNILQIKSTQDARNGNGLDQLVIPEQVARGELVARYETDLKQFFIRPKPLRAWCGELQVNYADLVRQIIEVYGGRRMKKHIWKGTSLAMSTADVIAVKFDTGSEDGRTEDP